VPAMQRRTIKALESIPGVESVGLTDQPPLYGGSKGALALYRRNNRSKGLECRCSIFMYRISPEYLKAAGTAVLAAGLSHGMTMKTRHA